ncbi:MAG: META domain-containing protein [Cyclobacteriaceae bacterium]|jgi:copper homeostasis protein (lipoprotein)|nr:META domain-containing protein [Cyclobacteriaceae bacterium]
MKTCACLLLILFACKPTTRLGDMMGVPTESSLKDTHWVAVDLGGEPLSTNIKRPYLILKSQDSMVQGFGGCNMISGNYETSGKKLTFGQLISTKMFCEDAKDLEPHFLMLLGEVTGFSIREHELTLLAGDKILAHFRSEGVAKN